MGTARFSVTQRTPWTVAIGPTGSGDKAYFQALDDGGSPYAVLSVPEFYTFSNTPWQSVLSVNGGDEKRQLLVIDLSAKPGNTVLFKFFRKPPSMPEVPTTARARLGMGAIWGVSAVTDGTDTEYLGEYLGRFQLTVGAHQATDSNVVPDDAYFGHRCTVVADRAMFPGFRTVGEYPLSRMNSSVEELVSSSPALAVDSLGYSAMIVELRAQKPVGSQGTTATQLGFAYRVG